MQKDSAFFEDMAKLASGAAGMALDFKREMEAQISAKVEAWLSRHQVVSREEFETVRAMAEQARLENETLKERIAALEEKRNA